MKAKDCMLGDLLKYGVFDKIVKVTALYGNQVNTNVITPLFLDDLYPIPITPEILKKTFGEDDGTGKYGISTDFYDCSIYEVNDGTFLARLIDCEICDIPDEQVTLCYVHQLQHFLNHCGIEKTIVL